MGMLAFFGSRAGKAYFVLPSDCDTLRKPLPGPSVGAWSATSKAT
jgi:hypothetical protein